MATKNISKVYLLSVPLENDYKHTLYFANKDNQESYFKSKIVKSYDNFTYQRKDQTIRIPEEYDTIYNCNYVMYQNTAYSNKWFYAFIKEMKFISEGVTEVIIETDVMQTWMFDYTIKPSFVEREHVSDDSVGLHTVPEGLETGDYVVNKKIKGRNFQALTIVVGATIDLSNDSFPSVAGTLCNGVYNGLRYFHFYNEATLTSVLSKVAEAGKSDGIVTIFMSASEFYETETIDGKAFNKVKSSHTVGTTTWSLANLGGTSITPPEKPTKIDEYEPKNKKLLSFPFCYLMASNNNGSNAIYKYERFSSDNCDFRFIGALTPGMSIRLQPLNYNNQEINNEEGLNVGKLPICAWSNDVYTNWLTQNGVNIGLSVAGSLVTVAGGVAMAATGAGALMGGGAVVSGVMGIASSLGQVYQQSLTPPQAEGNINNGDVNYCSTNSSVDMYQMSIKREYAEIIDKYFDMFGYKVNMVKTPNKGHRSNYWFTKTIDINIDGSIPNDDMQKIKNVYNNGVTFWRSASNIQNYNLSNNIV